MKKYFLVLFFLYGSSISAQEISFTRADSLRGSLNPFRSSFDVNYYDLNIEVVPEDKFIRGSNKIYFSIITPTDRIQLDLFQNMQIDSVIFNGKKMHFQRDGNAFFIDFTEDLTTQHMVEIFYHGYPIVAERPPWDGGFVWEKNTDGSDWIGIAVQGTGASLWWPNKDHLSDEPDSMRIICKVPQDLICVSNGQFRGKTTNGMGKASYEWFVSYPINNYNVSLNIARYGYFNDYYITGNGDTLSLDYYVLKQNLSTAKTHFKQVHGMLRCFEDLFGPYPFINDGYKLVETPYWGMEHQSAIAYGNNYRNNEFGFDFIIVHESGHEYWGNSISIHDLGQMWVHEAFTTYMEALYVENMSGYDSALLYLQKQKNLIRNRMAIQQPTGVNFKHWDDADMYYKGTWMLHTIRNIVDDDDLWFNILYELHQTFKLSIVTAEDIISFIDSKVPEDLRPIFDQYLNFKDPPKLSYQIRPRKNGIRLGYKWAAEARGFEMPLKLNIKGESFWLRPGRKWKTINIPNIKPEDIILPTQYFYFIPENME
jgi:aminopeptidase N